MRAIACLLLLAACAARTAEMTPLNPPPHPMVAHAPDKVEVFVDRLPQRDHVEVGFIDANLLERLRTDAAQLGCDGIVLVRGSRYRATCIVYK